MNKPSETVLIVDANSFRASPKGHTVWGSARAPIYRHLDTAIVMFVDGHVKAMKESQLQETATTEDGIALTGNDQFVLWNLN